VSVTGRSVLVVEDEEAIASIVRAYLERDGYQVTSVGTGTEALSCVERERPQLVVLDIGLPDTDGFELCRQETDRIAGLELGADDYVTKPFSPRELVARIRAVLRRTDHQPEEKEAPLVLGDVVVDRGGREVRVAGHQVELRTREFDLLAYLVEHKGIVLTRDQLLDRVWGLDYPGGTRTVDVHVAHLRSKLDRPELIETVRSVGYKAVPPRDRPES
jgi:DNA-binding response OmpR family regulator